MQPEAIMEEWIRKPWGIWMAYAILGVTSSPIPFFFLGGTRGMAVGLVLAFLMMNTDNSLRQFMRSLRVFLFEDTWTWLLFVWFLIGVLAGIMRAGDDWNIWITLGIDVVMMIYGQFLAQNDRYRRFAIWMALLGMTVHNVFGARYLIVSHANFRESLGDSVDMGMDAIYGVTSHWCGIATFLPIAVAAMMDERRWILKSIGIALCGLCCFCVMYSGFFAPAALLLGGGMLFALLVFANGSRTGNGAVKGAVLAIAMLLLAWQGFRAVKAGNDTRLMDASVRLNSLLKDPAGGEYGGGNSEMGVDTSRAGLAHWSWIKFTERPFLGWGGDIRNNYVTEGHNSLFDFLADYGLLGGGGAMLWLALLMVARTYRTMRRERTIEGNCQFVAACIFFGSGVLNPCWVTNPLCIIFMFGRIYKVSEKRIRLVEPPRRMRVPSPYGAPVPYWRS